MRRPDRDCDFTSLVDTLKAELIRERRARRLALGFGIVAIAMIPIGAGALGPVPNIFMTGDPLVADELNANFTHLQDGITAVEATQSARFCGISPGSTDGNAGGYAGISALCAAAPGCTTARARICLASEVVLSIAEGATVATPIAWVASGEANFGSNECSAFTAADAGRNGPTWSASPGNRSCDMSLQVVCCE